MIRTTQNNFSGGVLSPSLYGRSDLQSYYKGCAVANNFVVTKEGTLRKRHGIDMLFESGSGKVRIVPYKYDRSIGRIFVMTKSSTTITIKMYAPDGTQMSWSEGGQTINSRTISSFTGDLDKIQYKQIGDQVWLSSEDIMTYLQVSDYGSTPAGQFSVKTWSAIDRPDSIAHDDTIATASTHWSIHRSSTSYTGKKIYYGIVGVKDSVHSTTSKGDCKWAKSWVAGTYIDIVVTIAVDDRDKWDYVIVAKRLGGDYGEMSRIYMDDEPDERLNAQMVNIYPSKYTDSSGNKLYFIAEQVYKWSNNNYYNLPEGSSGTIIQYYPQTQAYLRWTFTDENISPGDGVYAQTNVLGTGFANPVAVDCFQQRRVFANATSDGKRYPMTLWFSEAGNIDNFIANRPSVDSDAFSATITSTGPAFIRWMLSYDEMLVLLTDCGIFSVGFSQTSGFSASSCRISHVSDIPVSASVQPIITEAGIVFVGADNKTLYTAAYDLSENKLKPINRSALVEHITRNATITSIALQAYPDNVIWASLSDGTFAMFTFERNEEVYAWSTGNIMQGRVDYVISIGTCRDNTSGVSDRTYGDIAFILRYTSLGSKYVGINNDYYVDYWNASTQPAVAATLTTLRAESQDKSIAGYKKNVKDVLLRLNETSSISVKDAQSGNALPLVPASLASSYTGDVKVMPRGYINDSGQMTFTSSDANPCEILQIVTSMEVDGL